MRFVRLLIIMCLMPLSGCGDTPSTQSIGSGPNTSPEAPAEDQVIKFSSLDSGYEGTTVVKPDGTQTSN